MTKISVLLPVFNAEPFLARTLDSILYQTFEDFEIIAINDGSKDDSLAILTAYAKRDKRVVVIDQQNIGLVKTLNKAASLAKGKYIARMDADDLSLPRRFELQLRAFEDNENAVLVAGSFDVINEDDEMLYRESVPTKKEELRHALFVRNPVAHGSVMLKKSAFDLAGGYSSNCGPTEDYELWSRLVEYGDIIGVPATIFRWRINPNGITQSKADTIAGYMKENLDAYTKRNTLHVITRSYLKKRGRYYVQSSDLYGVGMKEAMLKDCVSIGILFAKRKHYIKAVRQLVNVASTGRTGLRFVVDRVKNTSKYHIDQRLNR